MKKKVALVLVCRSTTAGLSVFLRKKKEDGTYRPTFVVEARDTPVTIKEHDRSDSAIVRDLLSQVLEPKAINAIMRDEVHFPLVHTHREKDTLTHYRAVVIDNGNVPNSLSMQLELPEFPLGLLPQSMQFQSFRKDDGAPADASSGGIYLPEQDFEAVSLSFRHFSPKQQPATATA